MSAGALAVCAAGVGLLLSFLIDRRRRQHEQLYVKRMQGSMLYYELYPLIALARKHDSGLGCFFFHNGLDNDSVT